MGVTQKKQAVIYRHPSGRFEIVETSWVNADGSSVRIRETVMTPQHDERGILSSADLQVKIAQQAPDPKEHKTSFKRIEGATRDRLIEMFDKGCPLSQIAETLGYSVSGIRYFVKSNNLTREKPPRRKSVNQNKMSIKLPEKEYIIQTTKDGRQITICTMRQQVLHCIGMDGRNRRCRPYTRHGKKFYRPWRNYFATTVDDVSWNKLHNAGLADRSTVRDGSNGVIYRLNRAGLDWIGEQIGVYIYTPPN